MLTSKVNGQNYFGTTVLNFMLGQENSSNFMFNKRYTVF